MESFHWNDKIKKNADLLETWILIYDFSLLQEVKTLTVNNSQQSEYHRATEVGRNLWRSSGPVHCWILLSPKMEFWVNSTAKHPRAFYSLPHSSQIGRREEERNIKKRKLFAKWKRTGISGKENISVAKATHHFPCTDQHSASSWEKARLTSLKTLFLLNLMFFCTTWNISGYFWSSAWLCSLPNLHAPQPIHLWGSRVKNRRGINTVQTQFSNGYYLV